MVARIVEITVKPDKVEELQQTCSQKILARLKQQPGFVDWAWLKSRGRANNFTSISYWRTEEDAQRYERECYARLVDLIKPNLENVGQVRYSDVAASTLEGLETAA